VRCPQDGRVCDCDINSGLICDPPPHPIGIQDIPEHKIKVEPSQVIRQASTAMFEMFTGLIDAGFTETQALTIIGIMMRNAADGLHD
jgi:hypothetical protein